MGQALFITKGGRTFIENAYNLETRELLASKLSFAPDLYDDSSLEERRRDLEDTEYLFSTWGMPSLTKADIQSYLPKLKAVFYAAGSVQSFAREFLECGVRVFSAWAANAVPVAEYTAAQVLLAGKGFFQASRIYRREGRDKAHEHSAAHRGNYGAKVGIIGAGMIGKLVIERLRQDHLELLVYDPFLPQEQAEKLGVTLCSLERLFAECQVITNHLANNPQTAGMLNYELFARMSPFATFLNTGRGAQVVEADLVRALREEPMRTAVLDVTDPEPVEAGHPFYTMENVVLTPHIAGSMGDEIARMGQFMAEEFLCVEKGLATQYEVTLDMLDTMA